MIVAHNTLKISPLYPFWRSDTKSFTVASGVLSFMTDNIYYSKIPSKLIIAIVSNSSYSGNYEQNPFIFRHVNFNYLEVTVDSQLKQSFKAKF